MDAVETVGRKFLDGWPGAPCTDSGEHAVIVTQLITVSVVNWPPSFLIMMTS